MNKNEPFALDELELRRQKLKKEIQRKERSIKRQMEEIFVAPVNENKVDSMVNYAKAGYNAFDGFMTGYKLLRRFGFFAGKRKKKH